MEKKYNEFIMSLELRDIFIGKMNFERFSFPDPVKFPDLEINLKSEGSSYSQKDNVIVIDQPVHVSIEQTSSKKKIESNKIFVADITFKLSYVSNNEMTNELFAIFKQNNLPVNIHPYLREIIHSSMQRCGLPPITLPVLRLKNR